MKQPLHPASSPTDGPGGESPRGPALDAGRMLSCPIVRRRIRWGAYVIALVLAIGGGIGFFAQFTGGQQPRGLGAVLAFTAGLAMVAGSFWLDRQTEGGQ